MDDIRMSICEMLEKIIDGKIVDETLNLLGNPNNICPRDLVYLLLGVQEKFHITIAEDDIVDGKFATIADITQLVYKYIKNV